MRSQSASASETGKNVARWTHEPVVSKSVHHGWVAKKTFGAWEHFHNKRTYVCAWKMSNKQVQCEYCNKGLVPDWRGYVPWYDLSYVPRFSKITYQYAESVDEIPHLAPIILKRGPLKTDAVVIVEDEGKRRAIPHSASRALEIDLGQFLVYVLWGNAELAAWDKKQPRELPIMDELPVEGINYEDPSIKKLSRMVAAETKAREESEAQDLMAGNIMARLLKPAKNANGPYKAPPKG